MSRSLIQGDQSPIIEMAKANTWFGDSHVLKDIDLIVNAGGRIVICGPSGSGGQISQAAFRCSAAGGFFANLRHFRTRLFFGQVRKHRAGPEIIAAQFQGQISRLLPG
ncbi:MAG TPA: hypothetical protein VK973_04760, partial [Arenicellales bacterium]|nr:hypothetical protein [Arenicellales bacterium]